MQKDIREAAERTAANRGMFLCIALNYGGRAEIVDAMNAILVAADSAMATRPWRWQWTRSIEIKEMRGALRRITVELASATSIPMACPTPICLIRTSGEMRVSNFLLWQIAYAEMFVTETLWPDFNRARLLEALVEYQKRERRYGGIRQPGSSSSAESIAAAPRAAGK